MLDVPVPVCDGTGMSVRIEFTVPDDFHDRMERARGSEPRAAFIKRLIAQAIEPTTAKPRAERVERARQVVKGGGDPIPKIAPRPRHWA